MKSKVRWGAAADCRPNVRKSFEPPCPSRFPVKASR
jgi:hypothetical protein